MGPPTSLSDVTVCTVAGLNVLPLSVLPCADLNELPLKPVVGAAPNVYNNDSISIL